MRFVRWAMVAVAALACALSIPAFAYGVFLTGGEENAPRVGGWLIAFALILALGGSLLLVRVWKRGRRRVPG